MDIISLSKQPQFIPQYVKLRNRHIDLLATHRVTAEQTRNWLESFDGVVLCLIENDKVLGAGILHSDRNGELTIFTSNKGFGYGSSILNKLEEAALQRGFTTVWAWTIKSNDIAQRFFEHHNYKRLTKRQNVHKHVRNGYIYTKELQ